MFSRHLREGPIAPEEFQQVCRSEIGSSTLNHKMAGLGLKPRELGQVIEEVGALYERFRRFPTEGFVGSEVAIEVEPSEGVSLLGTIDAVFDQDGTARLVDWKTGDLGEVVFQLGFYALIWSLDRGALPGRTEAVSVRTGERTESVPSRTEVVETARMVASMVDTLRRAWKTADPLARRGGPWCRFCPLLEGCEEGRAAATVASGGLRRGQS